MYFNKSPLVIFILCTVFISCQRQNTHNEIIHPATETDNAISLELNDTLTVKGNVIVFFKPTYEESVLLMNSANQSGFDSEIFDLESNYNRVMNILKNSGILSFMTTARFISVESNHGLFVHDRLADPSWSGVIFSSPKKQAKVINSIHTTAEYNREIKDYFF